VRYRKKKIQKPISHLFSTFLFDSKEIGQTTYTTYCGRRPDELRRCECPRLLLWLLRRTVVVVSLVSRTTTSRPWRCMKSAKTAVQKKKTVSMMPSAKHVLSMAHVLSRSNDSGLPVRTP